MVIVEDTIVGNNRLINRNAESSSINIGSSFGKVGEGPGVTVPDLLGRQLSIGSTNPDSTWPSEKRYWSEMSWAAIGPQKRS